MKSCFQFVRICPDLVISLNRTDKGLDRKSPKALVRGSGISKRQTLVFLCLSILLSISDGKTVGKKGDGAPVDNWIGNAGRLWTMEARNLFRLFALTSGDSGKLKLSWKRLLPHSFLTSDTSFLAY